jgi:hypothetical protein
MYMYPGLEVSYLEELTAAAAGAVVWPNVLSRRQRRSRRLRALAFSVAFRKVFS